MSASAKHDACGRQPRLRGRTVTLQSDRRGHFQVEARVDGRAIDFMVDTGASVIALRESSAAQLGIHPSARDYTAKTQHRQRRRQGRAGAAQPGRGQRHHRARRRRRWSCRTKALGTNLLGMSFLSRVKWTHDNGRLVLEQ